MYPFLDFENARPNQGARSAGVAPSGMTRWLGDMLEGRSVGGRHHSKCEVENSVLSKVRSSASRPIAVLSVPESRCCGRRSPGRDKSPDQAADRKPCVTGLCQRGLKPVIRCHHLWRRTLLFESVRQRRPRLWRRYRWLQQLRSRNLPVVESMRGRYGPMPLRGGYQNVGWRDGYVDGRITFIDATGVPGLYFNGGWCYGGFKATPASGFCFAHLLATGQSKVATAYRLDRFINGSMITKGRAPNRICTRRAHVNPASLVGSARCQRIAQRRRPTDESTDGFADDADAQMVDYLYRQSARCPRGSGFTSRAIALGSW